MVGWSGVDLDGLVGFCDRADCRVGGRGRDLVGTNSPSGARSAINAPIRREEKASPDSRASPKANPELRETSWETRMGNPISSHLIYVPNTCPDTSQSTSPTPQFSDDAASRQEEHLGEVCERCWWRWWRKRTRSSRSQQGGRCACAASEYECDKDKNRLQQEF